MFKLLNVGLCYVLNVNCWLLFVVVYIFNTLYTLFLPLDDCDGEVSEQCQGTCVSFMLKAKFGTTFSMPNL